MNEVDRDRAYRLRWWTLAVLSVSLLVIIVDDTIVNVALPTLQRELEGSAGSLQWIVDSYILVFGGLLLTMGTLGDRFGRRRLLQLGLFVFGAASLYGAYAGSTAELIAARSAMGVGGAMIMPSTLSILVDVFPRHERVRAIGIWAAIAHVGIPLGPVLGGWLLERYWWGSVLLVNVPIVVAAVMAGRFVLPESRDPARPRPDLGGMSLSVVALVALVYAIIEAPARGWWSLEVVGGFAVALVAGSTFIRHERRIARPMLDLRLFANARLRWGTIAITLAMFALAGLTFDLTQLLQVVEGFTPLEAGLRIVPLVVGFGLAAHLGQHLVGHLGGGRTVAVGLGAGAVLLAVVAQVEPGTSYWALGSGLFLTGLAVGAVFIPSTDAVMAAVPESNAGLGSGLNDTSRQVGAALGIGVLGSLTNAVYAGGLDASVAGLPRGVASAAERSVGAALGIADELGGGTGAALRRAAETAFTNGFGVAMTAAAVVLAVGAALVWRRLPSQDVPPTSDGPAADARSHAGHDLAGLRRGSS